MARKIKKDIEVCSLHSQRKRCFGEKNLYGVFKWVDAPYALNHDIKVHTGGGDFHGIGRYLL